MNKLDSASEQLMNKLHSAFEQFKKESDPFFNAFAKETDRAVGIVSACYLDNLLERLIRASYIKDPKVSYIFRDDQILQSFFSKINIAYFTGLIPQMIYHDLKLICEIRNKFAHAVIADLKFTDSTITQKIDGFAQLPPSVINIYPPRLKFMLVVVQVCTLLRDLEEFLSIARPPNPVELYGLNEWPLQDWILTPSKIKDIIQKAKRKTTSKE